MTESKVVAFVNEVANALKQNCGVYTIDERVYMENEFPAGFWRHFAKEVNHISQFDLTELEP